MDRVVFAADGAGNFQASSRSLRQTAQEDGLPLCVDTFVWSHGYLRIVADQVDYANIRAQGQRLADAVMLAQRENPNTKVFLMGHSAGAAVVLAALESLPPNTVEAAVLLAPSVSFNYDVGPSLPAVRREVTVFYSSHDILYLSLSTRLLGSSDRRWRAPAGRVGFRCVDTDQLDWAGKFQQIPWQPEYRRLGHNGGHYGAYQPDFLRAHVLPLFLR